jgi:hypothetical protein
MLADQLDYVVGVDPHRDLHALAIVQVLSAVVFEAAVAASGEGYAQALKRVEAHASGRRAFAIEGSGSFGAGLTRYLTGRGERALEVGRVRRERRSGGKTDALDAVRAARSVLGLERPATPRAGGERQALQALVAAREGTVNAKCAGLAQPKSASPRHAPRRAWGSCSCGSEGSSRSRSRSTARVVLRLSDPRRTPTRHDATVVRSAGSAVIPDHWPKPESFYPTLAARSRTCRTRSPQDGHVATSPEAGRKRTTRLETRVRRPCSVAQAGEPWRAELRPLTCTRECLRLSRGAP